MARSFWTLEDGRTFSLRWSWMSRMLKIIVAELNKIDGAENFHDYLKEFVFRDDDEYNGYGGIYRGGESIMFNFDLRSFAPKNRELFWKASQLALTELITKKEENTQGITEAFITLLDMHKRIIKGENPDKLNHLSIIEPEPEIEKRVGPDW